MLGTHCCAPLTAPDNALVFGAANEAAGFVVEGLLGFVVLEDGGDGLAELPGAVGFHLPQLAQLTLHQLVILFQSAAVFLNALRNAHLELGLRHLGGKLASEPERQSRSSPGTSHTRLLTRVYAGMHFLSAVEAQKWPRLCRVRRVRGRLR